MDKPEPQPTYKQFLAKFRRRRHTSFRLANDLHHDFDADVYMAIAKDGRYFVYNSTDDPSFPPTPERINMSKLPPQMHSPRSFKKKPRKTAGGDRFVSSALQSDVGVTSRKATGEEMEQINS